MSRGAYRLIAVFVVAGAVLLMVFQLAERHAETAALPRYCDAPRTHLEYVREILTIARPTGDETRRPYIIAAKLIYLIPRRADEDVGSYLLRLEQEIRAVC